MVESDNNILGTVGPILLALLAAYAIVEWFVWERKGQIASWLNLAERDLNNNLNSAREHDGRKGVVTERSEWVAGYPLIQVSGLGHKTIAEEMVLLNEADRASKGNAASRATITAFLLRELYEGNVETAQSKIWSEVVNTGNPPYIAPGIYELVGYAKFDRNTGFPPNSGVSPTMLKRVVRERGYPLNIQIIKADPAGKRFRIRGMEVLQELTQQKI
ncbi:MAG TPA: hypothetical protein VH858_08980 [Hyphomicrobiales bacterium]|jgi:hypothetical protein